MTVWKVSQGHFLLRWFELRNGRNVLTLIMSSFEGEIDCISKWNPKVKAPPATKTPATLDDDILVLEKCYQASVSRQNKFYLARELNRTALRKSCFQTSFVGEMDCSVCTFQLICFVVDKKDALHRCVLHQTPESPKDVFRSPLLHPSSSYFDRPYFHGNMECKYLFVTWKTKQETESFPPTNIEP